ncbi:MAG: hypothetical protein ABIN99_00380 [Nitrosospira sp.]
MLRPTTHKIEWIDRIPKVEGAEGAVSRVGRWVFLKTGKPIHQTTAKAFRAALERVGLWWISAGTTCHTWAQLAR